jgi:hypothetical protein
MLLTTAIVFVAFNVVMDTVNMYYQDMAELAPQSEEVQ